MAKKSKPKNPTDTTVRNVRAANKRMLETEARLDILEGRINQCERTSAPVGSLRGVSDSLDRVADQVDKLEQRVGLLEHPGATLAQVPLPQDVRVDQAKGSDSRIRFDHD